MANFLGRPFDIKPGRQNDKKSYIRQVLNLQPEHRLKGQIYELEKLFKENPFLMRYAGTKQLTELIRSMFIKKYDSREVVVGQGEVSDSFFIILSGRVAVHSQDHENGKVKELIGWNSFGEQCLLTGEPTVYSYVTIDACELIVLTKNNFDVSVKNNESQLMHSSYVFFKGIPLLGKVSEKLIHYFSQVSFIKKFMPNTVVVEQNEFAPGVYVVCEGSASICRTLDNGRTIFIDELGVGEFFCDNSFFTKAPMHHSVICAMPLVTYFVDKDDLSKLDKSLLLEFRKACKPYPDDEVLVHMYTEQKIWKDYKKKIIRTVMVEKEFKR